MSQEQRRFIEVQLTKSEIEKIVFALEFAEAGEATEPVVELRTYLNSKC